MALEIHGNQKTMNLPEKLYINIQSCEYFKGLYALKTYHEIMNEIRRNVEYMEPFIPKTHTPSTAFCLLFKCFTVRLTIKQLEGMLQREDNEFVRAIAMVYIRLACEPNDMWEWLQDYVDDEQPLQFRRLGPKTTMGKFCRDVIFEMKYCDILLPRVPVPIHRRIKKELDEWDKQQAAKRGTVDSSQPKGKSDKERALSERQKERQREREEMRKIEEMRKKMRRERGAVEHHESHRGADGRGEDDRRQKRRREDDREYRRRDDRRRDDRDHGRRDRENRYSRSPDRHGREGHNNSRRRRRSRSRSSSRDRHRRRRSDRQSSRGRQRPRSPSPPRNGSSPSPPPKKRALETVHQSAAAKLERLRAMYGPTKATDRPQSKRPKGSDEIGEETIVLGRR